MMAVDLEKVPARNLVDALWTIDSLDRGDWFQRWLCCPVERARERAAEFLLAMPFVFSVARFYPHKWSYRN